MNLDEIQSQLREQQIDGWLLFDHHHRDPLAYRVLGLPVPAHVSRRWYYLIPAHGSPQKLVHRIESKLLAPLEGLTRVYSSWQEHRSKLFSLLKGYHRVAMQYSPECAIPYVSNVDAGTIELVRAAGVEVISSAELIQYFEARLNQRAFDLHLAAGKLVDRIRADAFAAIRESIRSDRAVTEWDIAELIRREFAASGLITNSGPIVAVDAHAGDPHYEPFREGSSQIQRGNLVLVDMWAKLEDPDAVFYDITWTGFCGESIPDPIQKVFQVVTSARDAGVSYVTAEVNAGNRIRGFEVDDAVRGVVNAAGFASSFVHRTGHSIGKEIHGNGANMDNLETHDDRLIIPWSCFSIEPGIYLEEFGIRSELNVFVDGRSARVTGEVQKQLVVLA